MYLFRLPTLWPLFYRKISPPGPPGPSSGGQSCCGHVAVGSEGTEGEVPRYVFDEGHHLFDAADSAFSRI